MKIVYIDCDCDSYLHHESLIREDFQTELETITAFLKRRAKVHCGAEGLHYSACVWPAPMCHTHGNRRYHVIHGPGGHVLTVKV